MNIIGVYHPQMEWFAARWGILTSSRIHDAITKRQKGGTHDLAARRDLKFQMLAEMSSERTTERFVSLAMEWGIATEPKARTEYEFRTGRNVEPLGLVGHLECKHYGATADGWVKEDGGILEIKCPETHTHWGYLANNEIPSEYLDQIDWQMACCGPEIEWCDFVSYDPRIKDESFQMLIVRRERNQKRIDELEELAGEFMTELIQLYEEIKRKPFNMSREDKLRASIKQSKGQFPEDLGITEQDVREFVG